MGRLCRSSAVPCPGRSLRASCSATSAALSPALSAPRKGSSSRPTAGRSSWTRLADLGVELQTRLFRFVEERSLRRLGGVSQVRVDCRILCATNQDLLAKIKAGTFREELYYRLSVVTVKLPPLRERPEDIPHLAKFFLERFSRRYGKSFSVSQRFYEALLKEHWPGNVRQLKNVVERLTALHPGGTLEPKDLDEESPTTEIADGLSTLQWKDAREQYLSSFETSYAQAVLSAMRWQRECRGTSGRRGSEDFLRAAQARERSARWGIHSPDRSGNCGIRSPTRPVSDSQAAEKKERSLWS